MSMPEAEIQIVRGPLLKGLAAALVACGALAVGTAYLTQNPNRTMLAALAGIGLTGLLFAVGAVVMASEKPRPASTVAALWMGAMIVRLMGLLLAGIPIYFAAPTVLPPLAAGAAGAYLACLAVETAVVARQALRSSK